MVKWPVTTHMLPLWTRPSMHLNKKSTNNERREAAWASKKAPLKNIVTTTNGLRQTDLSHWKSPPAPWTTHKKVGNNNHIVICRLNKDRSFIFIMNQLLTWLFYLYIIHNYYENPQSYITYQPDFTKNSRPFPALHAIPSLHFNTNSFDITLLFYSTVLIRRLRVVASTPATRKRFHSPPGRRGATGAATHTAVRHSLLCDR